MENKSQIEIILETDSAPDFLANLNKEILTIESHYNSIVRNLESERTAIETSFANSLTSSQNNHSQQVLKSTAAMVDSLNFMQNQHKQQIIDATKDWENGTYVGDAISRIVSDMNSSKDNNNIAKWFVVGLGVFILFTIK